MGKTIFTDSEILMFARYEMSDVTLSSETPDFDEAPFKGPWESASDGHDIPVASSEPPPAPISKDSSESRRSSRTSRPRLQFSVSFSPRAEDERFRSPRHESRSKASQIANHLREVFTAGTYEERRNSLYESNANALLDEMGGNLYRYFLLRMEDERDLEWLDENILELATSHKEEAQMMVAGGSAEFQIQENVRNAIGELGDNRARLEQLSFHFQDLQNQLEDFARSMGNVNNGPMTAKYLMSLQYSLENLAEQMSSLDQSSSQTLMNLADIFASLNEPRQFLQDLGFTPNITQNPYVMRRLKEHLEDLKMFEAHMDNAFGRES